MRLRTIIRGYPKTSNDFLFDRRLNDHIFSVLNEFSRGKPALVFCPSRKGTSEAAARIAKDAARAVTDGRPSVLVRSRDHHQRLVQVQYFPSNIFKPGFGHFIFVENRERELNLSF